MSKWYCCNQEFNVRNVDIKNYNRTFTIEKGSFWYVDKKEKSSLNNNVVLSTNTIIIEITKDQLKNNFTDVS